MFAQSCHPERPPPIPHTHTHPPPPTLHPPPAEPVAWTSDLLHSPTVCHICISSAPTGGRGVTTGAPPLSSLPLLVQQASFSSYWPPALANHPGQQSGVNAPSASIVSELMKWSLPVPSHSLATRQMTRGNVLNGYWHALGVKSQSHCSC